MARLPRLTLAGHAHWLIQRGHPGARVFTDNVDRQLYLAALQEAAATEQVRIHGYALLDAELQLLATPATSSGLSRLMQSLGRRYVSAHHRRHGGSGTLWEGRFRCAVVQPGGCLLDVLCLVEGSSADAAATSLSHRAGGAAKTWVIDPPEYWLLGNTPFERQAAWRQRVAEGLGADRASQLRACAWGGWVVGSSVFAARISELAARPAAPRPRGRPRSRQG